MKIQFSIFAAFCIAQCLSMTILPMSGFSITANAAEPGIRNLEHKTDNAAVSDAVATAKTTKPGVYSAVTDRGIVAKHANTEVIESIELLDGGLSASEVEEEELKLLADLRVHSAEELESVLARVDKLFLNGGISDRDNPVVFLLHGDEARVLYQSNYTQNKRVVDLAAKLSAFDVVDIRVCESWSKSKGLDNNTLQPFVDTVESAPAEKKRLRAKQDYQYF